MISGKLNQQLKDTVEIIQEQHNKIVNIKNSINDTLTKFLESVIVDFVNKQMIKRSNKCWQGKRKYKILNTDSHIQIFTELQERYWNGYDYDKNVPAGEFYYVFKAFVTYESNEDKYIQTDVVSFNLYSYKDNNDLNFDKLNDYEVSFEEMNWLDYKIIFKRKSLGQKIIGEI